MDRVFLKKEAFRVLKRNYFRIVLVVFIVGIIINGGYQFTTIVSRQNNKIDNPIFDNGYKITKSIAENNIRNSKTNYEIVNDFVDNLSNRISVGGYSNGVLGTLFNNITESNSIVFGSLNAINLYLFNKRINIIYLSLIGVLIIMLLKIFVFDVFRVGCKRFFLEQRRYDTSIKKILFPFYVRKNVHIGLIILFKNIYQFLWLFTIVWFPIKYYEYFMIPYVLAENPNISKKDAFKLSRELMNGYKWEMFKLDLSFIGWNILNILSFQLLDIFFLQGYKECVYAESYMKIRKEKINLISNKELLNDLYLDIDNVVDYEYPMDKYSIPVRTFSLKIKKDYNAKYSVTNYILMFFIFSIIGWIWEVLFHIVSEGRFVNRGTMFGPWLPIYGVGGLLILICLKLLRKKPVLIFFGSMILAGTVEYITAWYLWIFNGAKWWDYTGYFLNIQGRVCLEGLLVFGLGGAAVTYFIGPSLNELLNKIKPKIATIICTILLILYGIDFVYSLNNPNKGSGITEYEVVNIE